MTSSGPHGEARRLVGVLPPGSAVAVRWIPREDRRAAADVWCALERRLGPALLSCSWDWTGTWLETYGDLVAHRFAVGEVDGEACGIALVTQGVGRRHGPFRVRTVHLGTAGEPPHESVYVEQNGLLVEPGRRAAFAVALMAELRSDPSWHELHLDGFAPAEAEALLAAEPLLQPRRAPSPSTVLRPGPAADGDVTASFRSSVRRKVRRSLQVLGEVELQWAQTVDDAQDVLTELMALHQRRWSSTGQPGAFASPRLVAFHRRLVARAAPGGRVVLVRVRAAAGTVGCLYHFREGDRLLFYQSGFARYDDPRVTPGFLAFALCMEAARERGYAEYDFLAGDSRYKRELSNVTRELVWATAQRPKLRWSLLRLGGRVRARVRSAGSGRSA